MIFMKESKARARGSMVKAENTVVLQRQAKGGEGGKKDAEHKRKREEETGNTVRPFVCQSGERKSHTILY